MALIHHTTMTPTKLELLAEWLPRQPWYQGDGTTDLRRAGGFRLDDPAGEVGIEFMVVTDGPLTYHVPMTYRGAPLKGAEQALIGTSEHGVLGTRWLYDGVHDPVLQAQLSALLRGETVPQMQGESDTPDPSVSGELAAGAPAEPTVAIVRVPRPGPAPADALGSVTADWTLADGTPVRGVLVRA
ncbi:1,4-alpha-glucan branching protein [Streptacidiphilus pinicola]|uniref:1,4-alpha-glucan branching protein n=1 Tax=Streptacidiphilus pinicola TaxID=2219663 RepID=A0A2X0KAT3_9ACTN|nr:1,4-alpha-glucan branching protein [Streptacidiphilus pinicola]RAG86285.1 1,4-alpha-glucan branching protein [Streptacidiphilus pinicola]